MAGPIADAGGWTVAVQNEIVPSTEVQSLVVAGQNNAIRLVYGKQILGADICGIESDSYDNLVLLCVWCEGEIDAVERYWVNGADPSGAIVATHYTGTNSQPVDQTLVQACSRRGIAYNDSLPYVAYSVFKIPPYVNAGFPQITALIRGKKVSSVFGGAKSFSENPAYALADFIENDRYGLGRVVDWDSVATVATHCDEMIGSPAEKRHVFGLTIDQAQPVEQWLEVLRDYAGCWVVPEGSGYRLVVDATGTAGLPKTVTGITAANPPHLTVPAHGFAANSIVRLAEVRGMEDANGAIGVVRADDSDHFYLDGIDASGWSGYTSGGTATKIGDSVYSFNASNIAAGSFASRKRGIMDAPTIVEVDYTNTAVFPWRTDTIDAVYIPGVYDSPPTVPFRRTSVSKPGLMRYSEANRYAIQLLNSAQLDDLSASFQTFDVALKLQVGDLVDVTFRGITAKIMRLTQAEPLEPGRWAIEAREHDDDKYSTVVVSGPSPSDTVLPSPLRPPTPTGLAVVEEVYPTGYGSFGSRLKVSWDSTTYPFVRSFLVRIVAGAVLQDSAAVVPVETTYVSKPTSDNVTYTVSVAIVTDFKTGTAATTTITTTGKSARPSDVPSISGFEVGGVVHLSWQPATDLDLTAYELRYSTTAGSWGSGDTLIDRIAAPALTYTTNVIPAGTWRIWIKALDSVRSNAYAWGQESVHATYCDVVVTSDAGAFLAANHTFPYYITTLVNMSEHVDGNGSRYWVSDDISHAEDVFTDPDLTTYTNIAATYPGGFSSSLQSEHHDVGAIISGIWTGRPTYSDLAGTADAYLALSDDDSGPGSYTNHPLSSSSSGRWAKLILQSTGTLLITDLGTMTVSVVGRTESGTVHTSATTATTVNLANRYVKAVAIQITPATGSTAIMATYDNVVVGSGATNHFDAYAFDAAGTKQAVDCTWTFSGI